MRAPWILFLLLGACGGLGNPGDSNSGLTTATPSWSTGATSGDTGAATAIGGTGPTTSGASASMSASGDATTTAATSDATTTTTSSGTTVDDTGPPETPHPKLDLPPFASSSEGGNDEDKDKDKDVD